MSEILEAASGLENIERMRKQIGELLKYETPDEQNPANEHLPQRQLFIEIGGPCTHVKIVLLTRAEHTLLKEMVSKILDDRRDIAARELDYACGLRVNRTGQSGSAT